MKERIDKTKAAIKKVSAADVKAAIDKKEKALFSMSEIQTNMQEDIFLERINVSRGRLEFDIWDKIFRIKNAKIYVYCKTAAVSAFATKTLNDLGYKNAVLMDALLEDWIKGRLSCGEVIPWRLAFEFNFECPFVVFSKIE